MKMFPLLGAMDGPAMPAWIWALSLFLILTPILLILFLAFYSKKIRHQQIMSAMDKGLPVSDFMPKPLGPREIGIRNLSAGIGFLVIGLGMVGAWYYCNAYVSFMPSWVCVIGSVIAGMGVLFLCRGLLQMQSSGVNVRWSTKLAAGIGFLFIGLAFILATWVVTPIIYDLNITVLIVAGVILGLGLTLLLMGILQKKTDKQKQGE